MDFRDETFKANTFGEFCATHGIVVAVRERAGETGECRYFASCPRVGVVRPSGVRSYVVGSGPTREEAVLDYARRLAGQVLEVEVSTLVELQCPNTWEVES